MGRCMMQDVIKSISFDQAEILINILKLSGKARFDADITYSKGVFYKTIQQPCFRFDAMPRQSGTVQADAIHLPVRDNAFSSIVFDPPFFFDSRSKGKDALINARFSFFDTKLELLTFYEKVLLEAWRVLTPKGILVFKCQDLVKCGKNHWLHIDVLNMAIKLGFAGKDLYVLLAKSRMIGHNHANQQHARKFHSYFWVLQKP